jgi:hypothetical protein
VVSVTLTVTVALSRSALDSVMAAVSSARSSSATPMTVTVCA